VRADRGATVRHFKALGLLFVLTGLTGCADIISGENQDISVVTTPKIGAQCLLKNSRGTWEVRETPASISLKRSTTPLTVSCHTEDGWQGEGLFDSSLSAPFYGNVLGGGIGVAVDTDTGAAYEYPERLEVALAAPPPPPDMRAIPAQKIDPEADRVRQEDDNLITRFQTLRTLLDEGLITRDEYNNRRGANLGVLLHYGLVPGARDLTRPAPPPRTLVQRLRYLAAAYSEHSISASEQAAERAVILDGLLPYPVARRADPPPPITDQMQLGAEIGRIERLRVADVITDTEATREKAKASQLLQASIAAADAAARAAAGMAATRVSTALPNTGIGVGLSVHNSEAQARRAWVGLQKAHPAELGQLGLSLKKIPRPHRPTHYQIVAGPLPDHDAAISLCKSLRKADLSCDAAAFGE